MSFDVVEKRPNLSLFKNQKKNRIVTVALLSCELENLGILTLSSRSKAERL